MGKRDRERIERINQGKEKPWSVIHPRRRREPPKVITVAKSQVGRQQRRNNARLLADYQRKEEIANNRAQRDRLRKLTAFGAMSPLP